MTLLYITIGALALLAAKSILDVRRLARRYAQLIRRSGAQDPQAP